MKKLILSFFCLLFSFSISSQSSENLLILNEGYFDFTNQEIIEPVSIGVYDTNSQVYQEVIVIDGVRFASDMIVDGDMLYVAADNKIIKYQIGSFEYIDEVEVQGARNLLIHNDNLFVSRGDYDYDTWSAVVFDSYLHVYDKNNLTLITEFDTDNGPGWSTQNLVAKDDQVFVAVNNGFEWNNEKGYIGVIDASTLTYTNEFDLGENGKNPDNMVIKGDYILTVNNKNWSGSSISRINLTSNEVITENLADVSTGCGTSALRGDFLNFQVSQTTTLNKYDIDNMETSGVEQNMNLNFYELIEGADGLFYASSTDFFSYGDVHIFNQDNEIINSFSTGVTPGVFAFYSPYDGPCDSIDETQIYLDYSSEGESNFSVYVVEGEELFTGAVSGSGSLASCFPTDLENQCLAVEINGDLNWNLYWVGTQGNLNNYLNNETIFEYASYITTNTFYIGESCDMYSGCMDEAACNYDENALMDNGSCFYAQENEDCDGNCVDAYTQMFLYYESFGNSSFSVSIFEGEELVSASLINGSGSFDSCFPTDLENQCLAVEISGDLTWSVSWDGTQGNLNDWLNNETIEEFATHQNELGYYFGEACNFSSTDEIFSLFNVYPNPTSNMINISGDFDKETTVLLFDNIGKLVYSNSVDSDHKIDVSNLNKGLYFLNLISDDKNLISQIIIE